MSLNKHYTNVLYGTVILLSVTLFWFAFVYYPGIVNDLRQGKSIPRLQVFESVAASDVTFPITTEAYRITYDESTGIYFVSVAGSNLPEFVFNRDNAKLALKSALSAVDLCHVKVVYIPPTGLDVPLEYLEEAECSN